MRRGVLPQAIAGRTANNRINRNDVEADIWRTIRPQAAQAEIVVNAAVDQNHAAVLEFPTFFKGERLVKGWKKKGICR